MAEKIREKFGLDYLNSQSSGTSSAVREDPVLTDALMAFGRGILGFLDDANQRTATVYEMCEKLQVPIEIALKIIEYFESRSAVRIVQRELKGNHVVTITDSGREMLRQGTRS